jgi:hypothetical protein
VVVVLAVVVGLLPPGEISVEFSWWIGKKKKLTATRQALRIVLALGLAGVSGDAGRRAAPALSATLSVCWTLSYSGADQGGERD